MLITIKFGGTSVGSAERIRGAAQLVKSVVDQGHQVVVVTSAMSGITNRLVALLETAGTPCDDEQARVTEFFRFTKTLEQDHAKAAREAIDDPDLVEEVARILYSERHGLERVLLGCHFLGEMTPIGYDFIVSEGERMCVPILANCLKSLGVESAAIGAEGCGIATDNNYGSARPLEGPTRQGVRERLLPILEAGKVPVAGGFFGRSEQGRIAVLGRGGSDYSATLVGCALDADEVWIMTDVPGIKTTDPRLVPAAHTIDEVPYLIAAEMSMLGAKILHPKSVLPAAKQSVPVRVASSFEPDLPGTRLVPLEGVGQPSVTALTLVRGGALVRLSSSELGNEGVVSTELIGDLRRYNVEILASATGSNGGSVLWLVGPLDLERFLALIEKHHREHIEHEVHRNVAVLGIVGQQVATAAGVIATVAGCLEKVGAQPLAILQGASPNSVVIALPDDDTRLPNVLRSLHTEFGLDQPDSAVASKLGTAT